MERPPQMPTPERKEHFPTREEILLEIRKYCDNPRIVLEREDEKGIFLLRVEAPSNTSGETVDYTYQREGNFCTMSSDRTSIYVTHLKDGEVVWAEDKAHYNPQTKNWE